MIKQIIKLITTISLAIAIIISSSLLLPQEVFAEPKPMCSQPIEAGTCQASFNRYAFNGNECVPFSFGGCEGNENNFMTLGDCQQTCLGESKRVDQANTPEQICAQPIQSGTCQADFSRYAFDGNECVPFSFGGCEGNENNFTALEDCQETCIIKAQQ
ncbi:BPTI/Kunitz-type proteinase inhibitor domain-containing protein [Lyngbya sp. PCC 8106]|uniref:BPTI/Kunitz-type proteinase inhibitor domain-containing protein n=1 Tax=Lyngbya sp. (strain PCC 8106) TaxID=313612 RepID=UPI0000EAAA01|nr:BPTI/Kunitz-type proteinase inhibitor domain-containing protein [Lyngbya sp. PCC 8106]EAW37534.1 glucose-inhibited division protein B [Lyngbya sp. PCC 8106]